MSYIAVTSVRNEQGFIHLSVSSVLNQSVKPLKCVVVVDGSTDRTVCILDKIGANYIIIDNSRSNIRGVNQSAALIKGISTLPESDYILKTDGDIVLESRYMEKMIKFFEENERLGVACGSHLGLDRERNQVSDGARVYRRLCYDDFGGVLVESAFDMSAVLRARSKGWLTRTIYGVSFVELRPNNKSGFNHWWLMGCNRRRFGFGLFHTLVFALNSYRKEVPTPFFGPFVLFAGYLLFATKSSNKQFK